MYILTLSRKWNVEYSVDIVNNLGIKQTHNCGWYNWKTVEGVDGVLDVHTVSEATSAGDDSETNNAYTGTRHWHPLCDHCTSYIGWQGETVHERSCDKGEVHTSYIQYDLLIVTYDATQRYVTLHKT